MKENGDALCWQEEFASSCNEYHVLLESSLFSPLFLALVFRSVSWTDVFTVKIVPYGIQTL